MQRRVALILLVALAACRRSEPTARGPASPAADFAYAAGEAFYAREDYPGASAAFAEALRRARATHDPRAEARALTRLGNAAWRQGNLAEAERLERAAIDLKTRLGFTNELSVSYNALGLAVLAANRNEEAARLFQRALETARAAGDAAGIGKAIGNLALTYTYEGDPRARAGHRLLREAGRSVGDARLEGNGLANEAMTDVWEGNPRPALARLDSARALYRRIAYGTGEENVLGQMASAFELTGEYDRAFAALDTALALARKLESKEDETRDLVQIAELHARIGDYRRAIRYFDAAEALLVGAGLEGDHAAALRGTAEAHLRLGNLARARSAAAQALRLHVAAGERPGQLGDLLLLAELDFRAGGMGHATARLREARSLAERLDTRGARIAVALTEAHLADLGRDPRAVLATLRREDQDMAPGDYGAEWEAGALAARAYARLGRLDSAVAAGRRAVAAVERLRGELASEALRATYVADRADVYGDLVLVLLRLGRIDEAFTVADGARSRELLDQMSAARTTVASGAVPRELLDGDVLLRRIDALVQKLRETGRGRPRERGQVSDTAGAALAGELAAARSQYEDLLIRAAQVSPRAAAILGVRPPRLEEVRTALAADEVLVEYLITTDRLLVFTVTRASVAVVQTALDGATLTHRVRLLRELWGTPSARWRDGLETARELHRALIAPLQRSGALRGATRLLLVPHGILRQLPFAALQDRRSGRFLSQDFSVSQLPSAASLPVLRHRSDNAHVWSGGGEALAPFPNELPATAPEVEAVRASLPRMTVRLGRQASEAALRHALAGEGVVHVATHGILNTHSPMFSRLELARRGSQAEDDGRLEVHELLGLSIGSPLVFLSGCETGAAVEWGDDPVRGTADLTIAQAVLSAGASNVIVTLWRIDDAGAAEFASRFYRGLERLGAVAALAAAQREMAADLRWASPYYWAGYTLSGEGRLPGPPKFAASASVSRLY
jgi:CHAT domain-containing protein